MATYYVKGTGDDSAAGTSDGTAWKTLDRARLGPLGAELVTTNAGFETHSGSVDDGVADTFTDWTLTSTNSRNEATATCHTGSAAIMMTSTAAGKASAWRAITVAESTSYRLEFWTRGDGTYSGASRIYDQDHSAWISAEGSSAEVSNGVTGTTYTRIIRQFVTPAGCTTIRIYLYGNANNGSVIYYDDVSVKTNGFSDGDTLSLNRGDTFSTGNHGFKPGDPFVNNFTLNAYGAGANPRIDGNYFQPIYVYPTVQKTSLTIQNIDISGSAWYTSKNQNLVINNISGITIDGVTGIGWAADDGFTHYGKQAIELDSLCAGTIEIKNCVLSNWGVDPILTGGIDYIGLILHTITSGTINVHDNVIHDCTGDVVQIFQCTATAIIHSNELYNGGENSIDCKGSSNVSIYSNIMYRTEAFVGDGGSGGGSQLGIHHTGADPAVSDNVKAYNNTITVRDKNGLNIGGAGTTNLEAYGNIILGTAAGTGVGINMALAIAPNIHGNLITGCQRSVLIGSTDGARFAYNVILNPLTNATEGAIYVNNATDSYIYNNTVIQYSGTCTELIHVYSSGAGTVVANNIAADFTAGGTSVPFVRNTYGTDPTVKNNLWYVAAAFTYPFVTWRGTSYHYDDLAGWQAAGGTSDSFSAPLFTDGTGAYSALTDVRLKPSSPAKDAGDSTVWSGINSVTDIVGRPITDGSGNIITRTGVVDRGACEYRGGARAIILKGL